MIDATASVAWSPTTLGTSTFGSPVETTIVTGFPLSVRVPAEGSWETTYVSATLSSGRRMMCGWRPALRMFDTASVSFWPWTNGTATGFVASSWSWTFV